MLAALFLSPPLTLPAQTPLVRFNAPLAPGSDAILERFHDSPSDLTWSVMGPSGFRVELEAEVFAKGGRLLLPLPELHFKTQCEIPPSQFSALASHALSLEPSERPVEHVLRWKAAGAFDTPVRGTLLIRSLPRPSLAFHLVAWVPEGASWQTLRDGLQRDQLQVRSMGNDGPPPDWTGLAFIEQPMHADRHPLRSSQTLVVFSNQPEPLLIVHAKPHGEGRLIRAPVRTREAFLDTPSLRQLLTSDPESKS